MATQEPEKETMPIDFYDAQGNVGEPYFVYVIQSGERSGGGTSCYFWFSSPKHFFSSLLANGDFWEWRSGWGDASGSLKNIVDSLSEPQLVLQQLDAYFSEEAVVHLYAWGTFDDLLSSDNPFCAEVRADFREKRSLEDDDDESGAAPSRAIDPEEIEDFLDFLAGSST
jgi:hypothetical protein